MFEDIGSLKRLALSELNGPPEPSNWTSKLKLRLSILDAKFRCVNPSWTGTVWNLKSKLLSLKQAAFYVHVVIVLSYG